MFQDGMRKTEINGTGGILRSEDRPPVRYFTFAYEKTASTVEKSGTSKLSLWRHEASAR
jgi:hypothetical protein